MNFGQFFFTSHELRFQTLNIRCLKEMIHNFRMQHKDSIHFCDWKRLYNSTLIILYSMLFFMQNDHIHLEQCQYKYISVFRYHWLEKSEWKISIRPFAKKSQNVLVSLKSFQTETIFIYTYLFYSFFKILTSKFIWDFMCANHVSCKYKLHFIN